jgi:phage minor structural protein
MLGDIDLTKKPQRPQLFLAKPDRTIIAKLNEAYNIKLNLKLGNINELSFELPIQVDIHGELKVNPHIDLIKGRYLIKLVNGNYSEWYLITKIVDSANEDRDAKIVQCFSLAYELKDKNIRAYNVTSYNATQVLTDALSNTIWTIGYIDADFDLKYRSFDVSNTTVLDFVFQIAETFGALIMWDTNNRTINFYKPENIGINRGLTISYKKYLKAVDKEDDFDTVVTRLKVFGRDGLSIQRVNPTGTNYIEDFSYFMYPFQRDENKNVLRHSDYMSDSLCNAILDYQELVESKKGVFNDLLNQLSVAQEQLTNDQNEYYTIETQLNMVLDELDIAQTTGQPTDDLIQQRDDLTNQLNAIQDKINTDLANIQNIQNQIDDLRNILKLENNFTPEQIKELNQFVIEEVWEDENYIDDEQLYNDAIKVFEKLKIPRLTVNVDIVNFLEIIEEQRNWDKLVLGDVVTINYERLNIKVQAKIIEIDFDYENGDIKLTIANTTEVNSDLDKYLKMLYQSVSTSATVDMNKYKWNNTVATVDDVTTILNNVWDTAKRAIEGGVNNSVTIDRRGITIKDPTDPNRFIRMTNGVIGFTNDGGNTFKTVLDASGVYAERLIGKILLGNNLIISDDTGTFNISGNLLTVKDNNGLARVQLGEYDTVNLKYGLKIVNKTGTATILDEDGMLQTWQEGRTDNVDANNPLVLNVYIPPETISIRKAILRFRLQAFRAYEKGAAAYGGWSFTSGPSSKTTAGTDYTIDTIPVGLTASCEVLYTDPAGSHSHSITTDFPSGTHNHGVPEYIGTGQHSHSISISSIGDHTHTIEPHHHGLFPHSHNIDHTHRVSIGSHSHDIIYGIYTSTTAANVTIKINGVDKTTELGGSFNSDQSNINIAPYLTIGQWNTIELGSSRLGRIDASIFIQAFIGV